MNIFDLTYKKACGTAANRRVMMDACEALAVKYSATWARKPCYVAPGERVRGEHMNLTCGEYELSFEFDGSSRVGAFLGHWHGSRAAHYPADFPAQSVNTITHGKATICVDTFGQFLAYVERGLSRVAAF
jgi:hypothetical protein